MLMAALELLCLRESVGKITPELRVRLRALQKEMLAARSRTTSGGPSRPTADSITCSGRRRGYRK